MSLFSGRFPATLLMAWSPSTPFPYLARATADAQDRRLRGRLWVRHAAGARERQGTFLWASAPSPCRSTATATPPELPRCLSKFHATSYTFVIVVRKYLRRLEIRSRENLTGRLSCGLGPQCSI